MLKRLFILVVFKILFNSCAYAEEAIIEVIPLYNRPASEIQPLLEPLLENGGRVIADGSNLLVRTTPARLAEIKSFIKKLDTRLNNLLITVLQSRQATADELNAQIRARLRIPGHDLSKTTGKITGYYYQTQDQSAKDNLQTIRTLEGNPAYIKTGNTYPVQIFQTYNSGYGYSGVSSSTEFIEATTGFAVTPRLSGQQVILDVSPWSDTFNAQGQIRTQEVQSILKVNLGEWVELGGVDENTQSSGNRTLARSWQTNDSRLRILIKVDKSD
jgi:type II secretory pathway component GspD/PulD (secretin)